MIDEIFDRHYQSGREDLHAGLDRLARRFGGVLGDTFATIKRVQFDAPWARNDTHCA